MRALFLFLILMGLMFIDLALRAPDKKAIINHSKLDLCGVGFCYDTIYMDRASSYYPSLEQCASRDSLGNIDSTSNIYNTADGSFINMEKLRKNEIQWCALPKSMLTDFGGEPFSLGDTVLFYSESKPMINGEWVIHDVVSGNWGKTVDFLIHPENNRDPKLGIPKDVVLLYNLKPILQGL